jgi:hypothetical protein
LASITNALDTYIAYDLTDGIWLSALVTVVRDGRNQNYTTVDALTHWQSPIIILKYIFSIQRLGPSIQSVNGGPDRNTV